MTTMREIERRVGAETPYWTLPGVAHHVVFRLKDSYPIAFRREMELEKARLLEAVPPLAPEDMAARVRTLQRRADRVLDEGAGSAILGRPKCARVVRDALRLHDGERYRLDAWCIMPNHVHVVVEPLEGFALRQIVIEWMSSSAHAIGIVIGHPGGIWHPEWSDHALRGQERVEKAIGHVRSNPRRAGLGSWAWVSERSQEDRPSKAWLA